ncbi:hypothetical protein CEP52_016178 [Fusarium oligoseptatum]|uniref:Ubiquitin-like domain-containing protein n=1 Tax=Fusarium oligoseptatum TaxID=2604345 RepID=A0A428S695_9HYPO|nr:hypothetical protein CEP52_016178 [Fusarium oligoseptatum]
MTQDTQSGKQPEDSLDKPILGSSPGPDGIETTMESNGPKSHDWKRLGNAVHPLPNDLQGREASPVHPSSQFLSRHIYIARDVTTEDETSGTSSLRPSSSNSEDGDPRDDEEGSVQRSTSAPPGTTSSPTVTASSNRILRFIPNWAHDIFSRGRYDDHKSDKLEAFLLELPARTDVKSKLALTKLEIGHTHIEAALSATIPSRWRRGGPQMWEQYKELDPYVRHEIHHAITLAKQWNNQSKTWIATEFMQSSELDQQGRVHVVLFFRLGDEVEPVTLDTGSRNFTLPYEHCRTWEMMEKILIQAFTNTELEDEVRNGRYDIVNNDTNAIIPPRTWRKKGHINRGKAATVRRHATSRRHTTATGNASLVKVNAIPGDRQEAILKGGEERGAKHILGEDGSSQSTPAASENRYAVFIYNSQRVYNQQ